jgi:hypothetical protein
VYTPLFSTPQVLTALHNGSFGCVAESLEWLLRWNRTLRVADVRGSLIAGCLLCRGCIAVLDTRTREGGDMVVECPPAYAEKLIALAFDATVSIASLPEHSAGPAQLGVDEATKELALGLHAELLGAVRLLSHPPTHPPTHPFTRNKDHAHICTPHGVATHA